MNNITIEQAGTTFRCGDGDTILSAGLRSGLGMPHECTVGNCGTCKFELLEGKVEVLWQDAPGLSERDRSKGRMLACQCRPVEDSRIKIRLDDACRLVHPPRKTKAILTGTTDVTHDIREFRFQSGSEAAFIAGQFALINLPGVIGPRAYSMANLGNNAGEWHFQVRRVMGGSGSSVLFDRLNLGDRVELDGPYGLAYLRTEVKRDVVCIAGGSGLAPMLSIARGIVASGMTPETNLHFFYGARQTRDVCGEEYLKSLPGFDQTIFYHPSVSSPDDGWNGRTGFVHEALKDVLPGNLADYEYYMTGPSLMMRASVEMLTGHYQVPLGQIHFDSFF